MWLIGLSYMHTIIILYTYLGTAYYIRQKTVSWQLHDTLARIKFKSSFRVAWNSSEKLLQNFEFFCLVEFSTRWLIYWPCFQTSIITSIMAGAIQSWFLFDLFLWCACLATAAAWIIVLPKITFALLPFFNFSFPHRWQFTAPTSWLQFDTWWLQRHLYSLFEIVRQSRDVSYAILAWNIRCV